MRSLKRIICPFNAKLYHKYEVGQDMYSEGNLIEVKFEDFEADAMGMTEHIYKALSIPGFAEARAILKSM